MTWPNVVFGLSLGVLTLAAIWIGHLIGRGK